MSEETKDKEQETLDNSKETLQKEQEAADKSNETTAEDTPQEESQEEEKELTVEEKLDKATEEIADLKDQLLRKIAEFDNYRKRTIKEKTELILNGGEKTIVSILPVIDDMERALKNMQKAEDVSAVLEGVELIYKKFLDILEKQGKVIRHAQVVVGL